MFQAFHVRKSDQCDKCVAYEVNTSPSEEEENNYTVHVRSKNETRAQRNKERLMKDKSVAVICIDLENVFS